MEGEDDNKALSLKEDEIEDCATTAASFNSRDPADGTNSTSYVVGDKVVASPTNENALSVDNRQSHSAAMQVITNNEQIPVTSMEKEGTTDRSIMACVEEMKNQEGSDGCPKAPSHEPCEVVEDQRPPMPNTKCSTILTNTDASVEYNDEMAKRKPNQPVNLRDGNAFAKSTNSVSTLLSLPADSLHCVASFLSASEWSNFGRTNPLAASLCRDVFRKVRLHGFRCATEVVASLKIGQIADARELTALYINSGVPIYPNSLGHSYQSLVRRIEMELREMEAVIQAEDPATQEEDDDEERQPPRLVDAFYTERYHRNEEEDTIPSGSYLDEKCLFWYNKDADERYGPRVAMTSTPRSNFSGDFLGNNGFERRRGVRSSDISATVGDARVPKVVVKVHRHLVDQHYLGCRSVNDDGGRMRAAPISLAADFFHPYTRSQSRTVKVYPNEMLNSIVSGEVGGEGFRPPANEAASPSGATSPFHSRAASFGTLRDDNFAPMDADVQQQSGPSVLGGFEPPSPQPIPDSSSFQQGVTRAEPEPSILSKVELEAYSAASANLLPPTDHSKGRNDLKIHLKTRFGAYQRRLESFLNQNDTAGFEECILDFWDEYLPVTANVHFYDGHTMVPRIQGLHKFLTKPCPKSYGIVQCEIERIKSTSKKKGVKGRLFPTYEYRLFIRDRRYHSPPESSSQDAHPPRRDTVLMVAKNRGRKHQDLSGIMPLAGSPKKGVNNYYLYIPQQLDIDAHLKAVNGNMKTMMNPNGAGTEVPSRLSSVKTPSLLGRLQSNFIGTEFQIFTPTMQKRPAKKPVKARSHHGASSDSDSEYDSGVSSDTNAGTSSRRRNRFNRRRSNPVLMRRNARDGDHPLPIEEEGEMSRSPSPEKRKVKRSYSLPSFSYRRSRSSRRAVAHSIDSPDVQNSYQTVFCEEEDGAITYTANLLGNRPRIMDVCIPRVSNEGVPGLEWKRYLDSVDDDGEAGAVSCRMLNHFKQLQQRLENHQNSEQDESHEDENGSAENEYSPPDDFGLLALQNRPPWWNIELGAFVLNFGGRVSVASVKNFQLCDRNDQDHVMLQFGRIQGRHSFTMDFQHPLTAVQAFAIAISSLQSRISFG